MVEMSPRVRPMQIFKCRGCRTLYTTTQGHGCMLSVDDEFLVQIFKNLPFVDRLNVAQVCQKWNYLSSTQAWDEVHSLYIGNGDVEYNLYHFNEIFPREENLEKLLKKCGRYLNKLVLNDYIKSSIMAAVKIHCVNLSHLELGLESYKSEDFIDAFANLTKLRKILINSREYTINFRSENLNSMTKDIHTIYYCSGIYEQPSPSWANYFSTIGVNYHSLRSLTLKNLELNKKVFSAITKIVNLEYLGLILCQIPKNYEGINNLINLKFLHLGNIIGIDNGFLQNVCDNMQKVECIMIQKPLSSKLNQYGLNYLYYIKKLKYLRVCLVQDIDDQFVSCFKNLIKVEVPGCSLITDDGINRILGNCSELQILNVMATGITSHSIERANFETQHRIGKFTVLHMFVHNNLILDFMKLMKPDNRYLVLEHDFSWQFKTRILYEVQ